MTEKSPINQAERLNPFKIKHNVLISYGYTPFDYFLCAPQALYKAVQDKLGERQIPGLEERFVLMRESHVFSDERLYLQMRRERLVFEICAAPFGTGYFVSSRLFDRRKEATKWDYLLMGGVLGGLGLWAWTKFDPIIAVVLLGFIVTTLWSFMRLAASETARWLDEKLFVLPWIGPIYESLFYPETYMRQDRNNMYCDVVNRCVNEAMSELAEGKETGPPEKQEKPVLKELFRKAS